MNLSPGPKTPIRSPQPGSVPKNLQLTPVWEEVVRNNRLPPDVSQDLIFREIALRLEDLEWPVRQHAFRVLYDIIPIVANDRLDERIKQNNILGKLVINLGHPAPGIRKVASETLQKYLRRTAQSEKMLEDFLRYGVREMDLVNTDRAGIPRENITLGTILSLADVLKPFIVAEGGGPAIGPTRLADIVEAVASKVRNPHYRDGCLETLWKLCDIVGGRRFVLALNGTSERDLILDLMNLRDKSVVEDVIWTDETKSDISNEDLGKFDFRYEPLATSYRGERPYIVSNESSEDCTDGTDTETYTKDPVPNDLDGDDGFSNPCFSPPSFVPIDRYKESASEMRAASPRTLLQAEIQVAKNKVVTMKVTDEGTNVEPGGMREEEMDRRFATATSDGDKVRTPRRVRFGGEVVKLRTPDSDTTDITIEIQEGSYGEPRVNVATIEVPEVIIGEVSDGSSSLMPVPASPVRSVSPTRDVTSARRKDRTKVDANEVKEVVSPKHVPVPPGKTESFDSAPSSSGSETDAAGETAEDDYWQWSELRLVEENIVKDLKNKDDWKIQYHALEQVKLVLINPKTAERIGRVKNPVLLNSLLKCLLYKLPDGSGHQVAVLSLSIVSQLIETLPKDQVLSHVDVIVRGLCRYVAGSKDVNLKIEAVQSLKSLFAVVEPSAVVDVLLGEGCLLSSNSRLRENALLAITYAAMTFPSTYFDVGRVVERVTEAVADTRRRVRHAALEAAAVLSQFTSPEAFAERVGRVAEGLSTPKTRDQLVAAIQARLSRRVLPSVSNEGLVLYALQIPASRRFGHTGNPTGADVDWILSGTGSVSTGSARTRTQLNAAQRIDPKPTAGPLSPTKWSPVRQPPSPPVAAEKQPSESINPWTVQKNRNEAQVGDRPRVSTESEKKGPGESKGSKAKVSDEEPAQNRPGVKDTTKNNLEDITWALVPLSAFEEANLGKDRGANSLWGDAITDGVSPYWPPSFGPIRPLYLKLQPTHDQLILSRSSDDVRRYSISQDADKTVTQDDFTQIRLLTPTVLREKNSDGFGQIKRFSKGDHSRQGETATRIPILCSSQKNLQRATRAADRFPDMSFSGPTLSNNPRSSNCGIMI